jgi:hypothetical protein
MIRTGLLSLGALATAWALPAAAHHPGSHATRLPDGRVELEVATVGDGCTSMGPIAPGLPAGVSPPPGAAPVTARLARPAGTVCTMIAKPVRGEAVLRLPPATAAIHVFIVGPDGAVQSTERVPVR